MISVCIATHNGGKYIKEELLSILPQLSADDEIVVSDDGSTDDTINEIMSIADSRIRVVSKEHSQQGRKVHYYVSHNFENALKHAKGDVIFLADQDDVWMPNKVSECLAALENNIAVLHNLECVDGNLDSLGYLWYNSNLQFRRHNWLMRRGKHMGCGLAFKRELLQKILPFPKNMIIHDFWIGLIAELRGWLGFIDKPLIKYRIHGDNASGKTQKKNSLLFKLYYRIYTIVHVCFRTLSF